MALIPTWYSASTKQIAEKALQRGVLKYPGLCYIQDSKSIAWVTIDNTLEYVKGDKQITDVKCIGSNLMFFSGDKLLFSYDISMTDEDKDHIIEEVKKTIGLDNYVKSSELSTLLDNIIGNLEDKSTVVDYINSLSYNKLSDVPIVNLIGTLTVPVKISSLDDGIYKVKGQCIIGGNNTTVQSSADDVLYLVSSSAGGAADSAIKLNTSRNITIGNSTKSFDGTTNLSWSLNEIGIPTKSDIAACAVMYGGTTLSSSATVTDSAAQYKVISRSTGSTGDIFTKSVTLPKGLYSVMIRMKVSTISSSSNVFKLTIIDGSTTTTKYIKPNMFKAEDSYTTLGTAVENTSGTLKITLNVYSALSNQTVCVDYLAIAPTMVGVTSIA